MNTLKIGWIKLLDFCLFLNLPGVVREFSMLRSLWEGGGGLGSNIYRSEKRLDFDEAKAAVMRMNSKQMKN